MPVKVEGLDEIITSLIAAPELIVTVTVKALGGLGDKARDMAKFELADVRYTGALESSFVVQTDIAKLETNIFPTAQHALFIRDGTKPHWAPIGPLRAWAAAKLGNANLAYPVQWSIARRGTSVFQLRKRGTKSNPWPARVVANPEFIAAAAATAARMGTEIEARVFE